jgi:hypothetical protein
MVMVTMVFACALVGLTLSITSSALGVAVLAAGEGVEAVPVGEAGVEVVVGDGIDVSGVEDGGTRVGDAGTGD